MTETDCMPTKINKLQELYSILKNEITTKKIKNKKLETKNAQTCCSVKINGGAAQKNRPENSKKHKSNRQKKREQNRNN